MDEAHLRLTTADLRNVGNSHCITLLESKTIESRADLRDAVITCYDNHGSVVNEYHNVAKFFSGLSKKREQEIPYNRPNILNQHSSNVARLATRPLNVIREQQSTEAHREMFHLLLLWPVRAH